MLDSLGGGSLMPTALSSRGAAEVGEIRISYELKEGGMDLASDSGFRLMLFDKCLHLLIEWIY